MISQQQPDTDAPKPATMPLATLCGAPFEPGRFLPLALAICQALLDLHRRNLIHGNLNPHTILVSEQPAAATLTGFADSPPLPYRYPELGHPSKPEVMPSYMSPEQTGRLNLAIDQRSDLYSLGVVFYQLLAGRLPFLGQDVLELVHFHIARQPQPPAELIARLPLVLSDIVLKLLAKNPDDRYQSAAGLCADLQKCLSRWQTQGEIGTFPLAEEDRSERLLIPQRLYGREKEKATLLACFERVAAGGSLELVTVAGPAGIGKTSLVMELSRPINARQGFFARGKFDQLQGTIPYRTIADAFRPLVRQILTEGEEQIGRWRELISGEVGKNGELLVRILPQVELIIGAQPPVAELPPAEERNRFHLTFGGFVRVFARQEHPLVVFLDDLQWADPASLQLIEELLSDPAPRYLLFIGAYRDSEVGAAHPLVQTLERLGKGRRVTALTLAPFSPDEVTRFLGDALNADWEDCLPLARLFQEKTGNNPFFVTQFLLSLYQEGLIELDREARRWHFELDRIKERGYTENVVDLMVGKLGKLPAATREAVRIAASFGNRVELGTLAVIGGLAQEEARARLCEAVREGLLEGMDGEYAFRHDRIQEAAYSLVPPAERPPLHLKIGRLLLARLDEEALQVRLFEVVNQLGRGRELIVDPQEKNTLLRLDRLAAKKAKASVAYACALRYLTDAVRLLPADAWSSSYRETFDLFLDRSECSFLAGEFSLAEELFRELLAHAASDLDRVRVFRLQSRLQQVTGNFAEALRLMLEALKLLGVTLPEPEKALGEPLEAELSLIRAECLRLPVSKRGEAPGACDPEVALIVSLLTESLGPAYAACPPYFSLCSAMAVSRCLRGGHSADCFFAYGSFAIVLIAMYGEVATALEFSEAAVAGVERLADPRVKGLVLASHGGLVLPWRRHLAETLPPLERGLSLLLEAGDFQDAAYLTPLALWSVLEKGTPLEEVLYEAGRYLSLNRQMHNETGYQTLMVIRQLAAALKGETREEASFDDDGFNEALCLAQFTRASWYAGLAYFGVSKLIAFFLFGRVSEAVEAAGRAAPLLRLMRAMPVTATLSFYQALAKAALYPALAGEEQGAAARELAKLLERLKRWAENCPENFAHRHALVAAQLAALEGRVLQAESWYEQAIERATAHGFLSEQALALELAASFYRGRGMAQVASGYLKRARDLYTRWGADGKVRQLEREHPFLLEAAERTGIGPEVGRIDALAVAKAMQAISEEMELDRLQEALMRVVLEQSGAERGLLLLTDGGQPSAVVLVVLKQGEVKVSRPPTASGIVPQTVAEYVRRTRESVIVDDARVENIFSADPYLLEHHPVSLLCLPVLRQNRLTGILYLENNLVQGAFTRERVTVLEVLAGQAAISLENARLYCELLQENRERKTAEENFRELLESAPDAMVIVGDKGEIRLLNGQAERLFGYRREELYGELVEVLIPPRFRESHLGFRANYLADPQLRPMGAGQELYAQRKDGSEVPVAISLSPLRTEQGLVVIATVRDISERKQAEEEIRSSEQRYRQLSETLEQRIEQAVAELGQKNRLLMVQSRQAVMGEMISNIAHQWRQPLNTLGLLAQDLQMTYRAGEFTREFVEANVARTLEIIRHMSKTIDDFRYFFRPGKEKELFSARDALEKTLSLLEASLNAHHIKTGVEAAGELMINGYPNEFSQVLLNIISNSRDAFVANEIAERLIRIRLFGESGRTVVTVTDNAGGIPKEIIEKVFEPYFTTKGPEQGTGIGLYMCKTIIEKNMSGSISVRNVDGGAEFRIELPPV